MSLPWFLHWLGLPAVVVLILVVLVSVPRFGATVVNGVTRFVEALAALFEACDHLRSVREARSARRLEGGTSGSPTDQRLGTRRPTRVLDPDDAPDDLPRRLGAGGPPPDRAGEPRSADDHAEPAA
jgi:hypothetical protein